MVFKRFLTYQTNTGSGQKVGEIISNVVEILLRVDEFIVCSSLVMDMSQDVADHTRRDSIPGKETVVGGGVETFAMISIRWGVDNVC